MKNEFHCEISITSSIKSHLKLQVNRLIKWEWIFGWAFLSFFGSICQKTHDFISSFWMIRSLRKPEFSILRHLRMLFSHIKQALNTDKDQGQHPYADARPPRAEGAVELQDGDDGTVNQHPEQRPDNIAHAPG